MPDFENWYADQDRSAEIYDPGKDKDGEKYPTLEISFDALSRISDKELIDGFKTFGQVGGAIQTGGSRNYVRLLATLTEKTDEFRAHILAPYRENFKLEQWWQDLDNFPFWGPGTATIYLCYTNKNKFSIINGKTLIALQKLGLINSYDDVDSYSTYSKSHYLQQILMDNYPNINNFLKSDAFLEYIVKHTIEPDSYWLKEGRKLKNSLEDKAIENIASKAEPGDLVDTIIELSQKPKKKVKYQGATYSRNTLVTELIKKLRNYSCQFCGTKILKRDGTYYIESCHIIPNCQGGEESLTNILVLCPNCHKTFDHGLREEKWLNNKTYQVKLNNGPEYTINFEN